MADQRVLERIAAWEADGLIDGDTAARLRASEGSTADSAPEPSTAVAAGRSSALAAAFGPGLSIVEVFAYLGGAFLVAAWHVLSHNIFAPASDLTGAVTPNYAGIGVEWLLPAVVLGIGGIVLAGVQDRLRRAAGVVLALSTIHAYEGVVMLLVRADSDQTLPLLAASLVAVVIALVFRRLYAGVLTQLTLLASLLWLGSTGLNVIDRSLFGPSYDPTANADTILRPLGTIAWWLIWAVLFALDARWERRRGAAGDDDAGPAARRAGVSRVMSGLTAVVGTTTGIAVFGANGRILEVWIGDVILLVVVAILLVAAFRFGTTTYLLAGALGIVIALSDLNQAYVAQQTGTGVALLLEGLILIGVGFIGDRLRRRLGGGPGLISIGGPADPVPGPESSPEPATPA